MEVTREQILARCRERVVAPDPVILLVLREVRDLGLGLHPVGVSEKYKTGLEPVCWHKDTYRELQDYRTAVVLDTPEMREAMRMYHQVTGGRFVPAKPEDHFSTFISPPANRNRSKW